MKKLLIVFLLLATSLTVSGCAATMRGAAVGAVIGAATGAIIESTYDPYYRHYPYSNCVFVPLDTQYGRVWVDSCTREVIWNAPQYRSHVPHRRY